MIPPRAHQPKTRRFLSPKLKGASRRGGLLFEKALATEDDAYEVSAIHYDVGAADPNIQVVGAALKGDRMFSVEHRMHRGVPLRHAAKELVSARIEQL